eukprot:TRINITY_DN11830_c0_g3_i1.p1 TRINITY_DN11830_c0_g3~~TRINITY_DN11830_c0_g3_i1.p1  ORF type:complete len:1436 (+),score=293.36 TRINITY_DN11830_c0_g3_i1:117-4310(+)
MAAPAAGPAAAAGSAPPPTVGPLVGMVMGESLNSAMESSGRTGSTSHSSASASLHMAASVSLMGARLGGVDASQREGSSSRSASPKIQTPGRDGGITSPSADPASPTCIVSPTAPSASPSQRAKRGRTAQKGAMYAGISVAQLGKARRDKEQDRGDQSPRGQRGGSASPRHSRSNLQAALPTSPPQPPPQGLVAVVQQTLAREKAERASPGGEGTRQSPTLEIVSPINMPEAVFGTATVPPVQLGVVPELFTPPMLSSVGVPSIGVQGTSVDGGSNVGLLGAARKSSSSPLPSPMQERQTSEHAGASDSGSAHSHRRPDRERLSAVLPGDAQRISNAGSEYDRKQEALDEIGGNIGEDIDGGLAGVGVILGHLQEDTGAGRIAKLRLMFDQIDTDQSGSIDVQEFMGALPHFGLSKMSEEDVRVAMAEVDANDNGMFEFDDFVRFFDLLEGLTTGETRNAAEVLASVAGGKGLAKVLQEEKQRLDQTDMYTTGKKRDARARLYALLYDMPVLAPDYTPRRWWDVAVLFTVMYHWLAVGLTLIHPRLAFDYTAAMAALESIATLVLICDVIVHFNTAVPKKGQFRLITDRKLIAQHYVTRWFWLDVAAALPVDLVVCSWGSASDNTFRAVRCLRLLKLFRVQTLFPMTERGVMDAPFVRFYCWYVPMVLKFWNLVFWAHALALGRMIVAPATPDVPESECPSFGLDRCQSSPLAQYGYALFWMWSLCIGQGLAAVESTKVFGFAALVFLVALLVQGHVMAQMSAIFIKSNVKQMKVDSMRSVLGIMKFYGIPHVLQREVLSFNHHTLEQNAVASLAETLSLLPQTMQSEVGLFVRVKLVSEVPMFKELSQECRLALAGTLRQVFAEPEEPIITHGDKGSEMYFIIHGFAEVVIPVKQGDLDSGELVVATVKRGDFFGEVALLVPGATRTASIRALTYCDLFRLDADAFVALFDRFAELSYKMESEARNRGLLGDDKKDQGQPDAAASSGGGPAEDGFASLADAPAEPDAGADDVPPAAATPEAVTPAGTPLETLPLALLSRSAAAEVGRQRVAQEADSLSHSQSFYNAVHLRGKGGVASPPGLNLDGSAPTTPSVEQRGFDAPLLRSSAAAAAAAVCGRSPPPAPIRPPAADQTRSPPPAPLAAVPRSPGSNQAQSPFSGSRSIGSVPADTHSASVSPSAAGPDWCRSGAASEASGNSPGALGGTGPPPEAADGGTVQRGARRGGGPPLGDRPIPEQQVVAQPQPSAAAGLKYAMPQRSPFGAARGGRGRGRPSARGRGGPAFGTAGLDLPPLPKRPLQLSEEAARDLETYLQNLQKRVDSRCIRAAEQRHQRCQERYSVLRLRARGLHDMVENVSRRALQRMQHMQQQHQAEQTVIPGLRRAGAEQGDPFAFGFAKR